MKGRDSSYSTSSGAVISLSKWAVFVSGPWEGIFSCVGRQCAVTDSNTQRTSALVLTTQTHTTGRRWRWCVPSVPLRSDEAKIYSARWSTAPHTHTNTHTHTPAFALWSRILDVQYRGAASHNREHHHPLLHVCVPEQKQDGEMQIRERQSTVNRNRTRDPVCIDVSIVRGAASNSQQHKVMLGDIFKGPLQTCSKAT